MPKKIVLITPGQPSTNPRLVKEAITLSENGFEVAVLYCFWVQWAVEFDQKIIQDNPQIRWIETGGNPISKPITYYISRIKNKLFRKLNKFFQKSLFLAKRTEMRAYGEFLKIAKESKADLFIAHNLGALGVAADAAKATKSKFGFDAEDYHRGQVVDNSSDFKRVILIEDALIPNANYITAASPQIASAYESLYKRQIHLINNVFPIKYLSQKNKEITKPISLFWFSQTVGKGRGLEYILLALRNFNTNEYSLTILGKADENIKNYLTDLNAKDNQNPIKINFINPVAHDYVFEISASYDIGLALETGKDKNNKVALSNKIFTYLLSGNAILFSNTPAQEKFFKQNDSIGQIYHSGNVAELVEVLKKYSDNFDLLKKHKSNALQIAATKMNWEKESNLLLSLIKAVI